MFKKTRSKGIDFISFFLILSIFSKELFSINIGGVSVDLFSYTFFTIYFFFHVHKFKLPKEYFLLFIILFFSSIISILIFKYEFESFFKVFIPIVIIFSSSYDIIFKRMDNLFSMFNFYLKTTYFVAIFGLIQWSLSLIGVNIIINQPGLLDSIAYEPSHYAVIVSPAALYYLKNFKKNKITSIIINLSLILTFSFTAYFTILVALLISFLNFRNILKLVFSIFLFVFLFNFFPDRVKDRWDSLINLVISKKDFRDSSTNLTTMSFVSNFEVAIFSIRKNFLTGAGLGMNKYLYDEYYSNDNYFQSHRHYGINSQASHSLTLRIISELGLFGIIIYVLFINKNYIKLTKSNRIYHIISLAILTHFLAKTIKLSGYIDYGTPIFVAFLLINKLHYKLNKQKVINNI